MRLCANVSASVWGKSLTGSGYTLSLGIPWFMWRADACLEVHMNGKGEGGGGSVFGAGSERGALRGLPPKMERH